MCELGEPAELHDASKIPALDWGQLFSDPDTATKCPATPPPELAIHCPVLGFSINQVQKGGTHILPFESARVTVAWPGGASNCRSHDSDLSAPKRTTTIILIRQRRVALELTVN